MGLHQFGEGRGHFIVIHTASFYIKKDNEKVVVVKTVLQKVTSKSSYVFEKCLQLQFFLWPLDAGYKDTPTVMKSKEKCYNFSESCSMNWNTGKNIFSQ